MNYGEAIAIVLAGFFLGGGAYWLGARNGYEMGKQAAKMLAQIDKLSRCTEIPIFSHPQAAKCPCECGGVIQSDGRNKSDNVTFLVCSKCRHRFVARDRTDEEEDIQRVS